MSKTKKTFVEIEVRVPMKSHLAAFVVYYEDLKSKDQALCSKSKKVIPSRLREFFYPEHIYNKELRKFKYSFGQYDSHIRFKLSAEMKKLNRLKITPQAVSRFNSFVHHLMIGHINKLIQAERESDIPLSKQRTTRRIIKEFLDRIDAYEVCDWDTIRRSVDRYTSEKSVA